MSQGLLQPHLLLLLCILLQSLPVPLGLLHHLFMGDTYRKCLSQLSESIFI